jgi:hypothetical protein
VVPGGGVEPPRYAGVAASPFCFHLPHENALHVDPNDFPFRYPVRHCSLDLLSNIIEPTWPVLLHHSFLRGRAKVDLYLLYLVSFGGEKFRVPGAAAILGLAVVEDKSFIAFLKHLLNAILWGFLAVRPAALEIGFTVDAMVVRTGKDEVIRQERFDGLTVFVFVGGKILADEV